jgi:enoyl-CoA hydratase/carnithine racemase
MPEVRLGIPSVVEAALLPRLIGAGRARWLVMTGDTIAAGEALAWGLVERLAPAAQLDTAVNAALDSLLAASDAAQREQKRLCHLWRKHCRDERARWYRAFARAYETREPAQRIAQFRTQRGRSKSPQ